MKVRCQNFKHSSKLKFLGHLTIIGVLIFASPSMWAKNLGGEGELLPVSIHKAINLSSRGPANIIPDDEIEIEPIKQTLWYENLLVEDDSLITIKQSPVCLAFLIKVYIFLLSYLN